MLIAKPGKPQGELSSFRPLCLLDAPGKLLELLIQARLVGHLDSIGALSERQFGFRKEKSTLDACAAVMEHTKDHAGRIPQIILLDVKNAFNSAPWEGILARLRALGVEDDIRRLLQSYLKDRALIAETTRGQKRYTMTCGVPQGSILGPILWNVLYNGTLEVPLPAGCKSGAYADDFVIMVEADSAELLKVRAEDAYDRVTRWIQSNGIQLEPSKTEALIVCGRRRLSPVTLNLRGHPCTTKDKVKYLGVWMSRAGHGKVHAKEQATKAQCKLRAITGILANTGGPKQVKRQIMASAVTSIVTHAAPAWSEGMKPTFWKPLETVNRCLALRIAGAFRTVRGMLPLSSRGSPQ